MNVKAWQRIGAAVYIAAYWDGCEDRPHESETMTQFKKRRRAWRAAQAAAQGESEPEQVVQHGFVEARGPSGRRVSADLPPTLMMWYDRGQASAAMVRAAGQFIRDYDAGYSTTVRGVNYRERVDGGGGSGDGEIVGMDARQRHCDAMAAMGLATGPAVKAWLVDGVVPVEAVAVASGWTNQTVARGAAGGVLLIGLDSLAKHYG